MPKPRQYGVRPAGGTHSTTAVSDDHMPTKELGRHRWTAIACYSLTASQASAADNGAAVTLGPDMLVSFLVGCIDCEQPYETCRLDPCSAGDEWGQDR